MKLTTKQIEIYLEKTKLDKTPITHPEVNKALKTPIGLEFTHSVCNSPHEAGLFWAGFTVALNCIYHFIEVAELEKLNK